MRIALATGTVAMVLALVSALFPAGDGAAQGNTAPAADALRVTWQPRAYSVVPAIEGYVENATPFRVTSVRLRVEGFDASAEPVGETSTWVFGSIPPRGRGHFVVPPVPRAATHRITVSGFDRVSREEPVDTQSP